MGADLGSRALAQSLPCAATTLSLWSPLSLSGHMQDATTAARQAHRGAPCPERASHIGQRRETCESDPAARKSHVHGRRNNRMLLSKSVLFLSSSQFYGFVLNYRKFLPDDFRLWVVTLTCGAQKYDAASNRSSLRVAIPRARTSNNLVNSRWTSVLFTIQSSLIIISCPPIHRWSRLPRKLWII